MAEWADAHSSQVLKRPQTLTQAVDLLVPPSKAAGEKLPPTAVARASAETNQPHKSQLELRCRLEDVADRLEGFSHVGRDDVTSRYIAAVTKHDWAEDMIRFYNGCVTDDTHKNNVPKNYTQGNNRIQMLG